MDEKKTWKIINSGSAAGTLVLAVFLIASTVAGASAPQYYCDTNGFVASCDKLSSTEKTCYFGDSRKVCRLSKWVEVTPVEADRLIEETETIASLPAGTLITTRTASGVFDCEVFDNGIQSDSNCYDGRGKLISTYDSLQ